MSAEILKLENENEIKKTTEIANNESVNSATSQIFGSIFNKDSVQEQLDKAIKEAFNQTKVKGGENRNDKVWSDLMNVYKELEELMKGEIRK